MRYVKAVEISQYFSIDNNAQLTTNQSSITYIMEVYIVTNFIHGCKKGNVNFLQEVIDCIKFIVNMLIWFIGCRVQ